MNYRIATQPIGGVALNSGGCCPIQFVIPCATKNLLEWGELEADECFRWEGAADVDYTEEWQSQGCRSLRVTPEGYGPSKLRKEVTVEPCAFYTWALDLCACGRTERFAMRVYRTEDICPPVTTGGTSASGGGSKIRPKPKQNRCITVRVTVGGCAEVRVLPTPIPLREIVFDTRCCPDRRELTFALGDGETGNITLEIEQLSSSGKAWFTDGWQFEAGPPTTFTDGERDPLCESGGRVVDLCEWLGFEPQALAGLGMPPVQLVTDTYAINGGKSVQGAIASARTWSIAGVLLADTTLKYHEARLKFMRAIAPDPITRKPRRAWFRYRLCNCAGWGCGEIEFGGYYTGGLEMNLSSLTDEMVTLTFEDPSATGIFERGERCAKLLSSESFYSNMITVRQADGQWLGLNAPGYPYALEYGPDGMLYVGSAGGIWKWDGTDFTKVISVTGNVRDMAFAPDGKLYFCGSITSPVIGAGVYDPVVGEAKPLGAGQPAASFVCMALNAGKIYFGSLTGGFAVYDLYVGSWSQPGGGVNGAVNTLAIDSSTSKVYIGGLFTSAGGVSAANVAIYNPQTMTYAAAGSGMNGAVNALAFVDGLLYASGEFTLAGGTSAKNIAMWNGAQWSALGAGLNLYAAQMTKMPNGHLLAVGGFTASGDKALPLIAEWTGTAWVRASVKLPSTGSGLKWAWTVATDGNGNLAIGHDLTGETIGEGVTEVEYCGSAPSQPYFSISGPGILHSIRNDRTGDEILFDGYAVAEGETVTIDLRFDAQTLVWSSYYGNMAGRVLPISNLATFRLVPSGCGECETNRLAVYAPGCAVTIGWRVAHLGIDGIAAKGAG